MADQQQQAPQIKRRTKVIINPSLKEINETSKNIINKFMKNSFVNKGIEMGQLLQKKTGAANFIKNKLNKIATEDFNPIDTDDDLETDPSVAVSDPYKAIGDKNNSLEVKDLAFKIIMARSVD